jgi:hypothetical protein
MFIARNKFHINSGKYHMKTGAMIHSKVWGIVLASLLGCATPLSFASTIQGYASASAGTNGGGNSPISQDSFNSDINGTATASNMASSSLAAASSSASSSVSAGALHVSATSAASGTFSPVTKNGDGGSAQANANGRLYDSFVVNSSQANFGTQGTITIGFSIDGSVMVDGMGSSWSGAAQWLGHVSVQGTQNGGGYSSQYWSGGERMSGSSGATPVYTDYDSSLASIGMHTMTLGIYFGSAVNLDIGAELVSQSGAGGACYSTSAGPVCFSSSEDSIVNLSNTISWGGILEARDASGALITDFTALSDTSGFNYANAYAVPIPAAIWLFGSGLIGLVGFVGRKKA